MSLPSPGVRTSVRRTWRPAMDTAGSTYGLTDTEHVPRAVAEPGGPFAGAGRGVVSHDLGDVAGRAQAGEIDLLEHHAARPQPGDHGLDVVDHPPHLGVIAGGHAGRLEQREPRAAALVEQAAGALLDRFQTELVRVERSCPGEVLGREPGGDWAVVEHGKTLPRLAAPCHGRSRNGTCLARNTRSAAPRESDPARRPGPAAR